MLVWSFYFFDDILCNDIIACYFFEDMISLEFNFSINPRKLLILFQCLVRKKLLVCNNAVGLWITSTQNLDTINIF